MGVWLMVCYPLAAITFKNVHLRVAVGGAVVGLGCFISAVVLERRRV